MPRPFVQLSRDAFLDLLRQFPFTRRIDAIHMHHTFIPRKSQFRGVGTIEAMERDHRSRGFSDIAQHVTIAPDGTVWTGRSWNQAPASATGHNGNSVSGPFMFETVGNFDQGQEELGGAQRETVLATIVTLQKRFGLPLESLRFHNQMSSKSCPGDAIDYQRFLEEVRAAHQAEETGRPRKAARGGGSPFGSQHAEDPAAVRRALEALAREAGAGDEGELDENEMAAERRDFLGGASDFTEPAPAADTRALFGPRRLTAEEKDSLRPHVINLKEGRLIEGGEFFSLDSHVRAIFTEHLEEEAERKKAAGEKLRLVFYAHGGLTKERSGLHRALSHVRWWKKNGVYPIYFAWETGLLQQIGQLIRERGDGARGVVDVLVEASDEKIEKAARRLGGERIWSGMKRNAEVAVTAADGGSALTADLLAAYCTRHPEAELHAVGHSAGAIFHAHFLPAAFAKGVPAFESLHFMAPAIRLDAFHQRLKKEVGKKVKHLTMFTMKTDFELDDNCATIYRKSLLYLIRHALEREERAELLGLEESVRRDPDLVKLFGLEGNPRKNAEIVFSKTLAQSGRSASRSEEHGGFDDDGPTMNSIALRILGLPDNGAIEPYPDPRKDRGRALERAREEDPWAAPDLSDLFPPAPLRTSTVASGGAGAPQQDREPVVVTAPGGGARRALCIGINAYRDKPLGGCVADAKLWEQKLQGLGFTTSRLLDAEATYERLRAELRQLVTSSRPGDVVVFQYAGHGAQVPDHNADEASGEAGPDEALCPVDYHEGRFLIDDDIAEIMAGLPDGVNFTFFMDNCNSGGISRFGLGPASRALGEDARSRFLPLTEEMKQAHAEFRRARGGSRAAFARGPRPLRGVFFAACQADELAWEVNGQGEFTARATPLLQSGASLTNQAFSDRVLQAFGSGRRQTPRILCEDSLLSLPLLAPLRGSNG